MMGTMSLLDEMHQERMQALYQGIDNNFTAQMAVEDAEWKRRIENGRLNGPSLVVDWGRLFGFPAPAPAPDLLDLAREVCR